MGNNVTKFMVEVRLVGYELEPVGVWYFTEGAGLKFWYNHDAEFYSGSRWWQRRFTEMKLPFDDPNILFAYLGGEGQRIDRYGVFETDEKWEAPEELIEIAGRAKVLDAEKQEYYSRNWWDMQARENPSKSKVLPESNRIKLQKNTGKSFIITGGMMPPRPKPPEQLEDDDPNLFDDEDSDC